MADKEKIDIFLQKAREMGITLDELIEYRLAKDHSFLSMSSKIKLEYDRFFDKLLEEYKTTKEKGDVLESLASCLMFSEENVFNLKKMSEHLLMKLIYLSLCQTRARWLFLNYMAF